VNPNDHNGAYGPYSDDQTSNSPQEAMGSIPLGAAGPTDPKKGYWAGRQYEPAPQEMPSPQVVHEMPAGR